MFNMLFSTLFKMLLGILSVLKYPVIIIVIAICVLVLDCIIWYIILRGKGYKMPKNDGARHKEPFILKKLFYDFPRRFMLDRFNRPANWFAPQGLVIYESRQGGGKTSTMTRDIMLLQKRYPHCKVLTNYGYLNQDEELNDWKQLITYKNGHEGVVVGMDETQNWFSSKQSQNFPPEMLSVVTQNRKNRRVIFGSAQNFYMLAKDIRTQCTEVRRCTTLFGCITIIHRLNPICDSAGDVQEYKSRGWYWYVHGNNRDMYDTYRVVEALAKSGFKDPVPDTDNRTFVTVNNKIKK